MSEFALRGYNVASPEIDQGDDLFVVNHATSQMWRIQVKTSVGTPQQNGTIYFQSNAREAALHPPNAPASHFVFVLRLGDRWRFLVIGIGVLHNYIIAGNGMGTLNNQNRVFTFIYNPATHDVTCSGINLNHHLEDWVVWPII